MRRPKPGRKTKKVGRAWSFHATKDEKSFLKQYGLLSDEESSAKEEEKSEKSKEETKEEPAANNNAAAAVSFDLRMKDAEASVGGAEVRFRVKSEK